MQSTAINSRTVAMSGKKTSNKPSAVFKVGAISLAFMILGYQVALFMHRAATERIVANRDHPDTVYVLDRELAKEILADSAMRQKAAGLTAAGSSGRGQAQQRDAESALVQGQAQQTVPAAGQIAIKKPFPHSPASKAIAEKYSPRKVESFEFNPNTVSVDDLMRLGFSEKQAASIDNYRNKGGRFRRKSDFAKSFVVSDSVYKRLEKYISIPKIDINKADSAEFDSLPGIGGWFAKNMVEYRSRLRGYSCTEQLMEIYRFDAEKYEALKDLITCSEAEAYPFWSAPADSLRLHPHIRSWQTAKAIVFYREHNTRDKWTIDALLAAGIISEQQAARLRLCKLN